MLGLSQSTQKKILTKTRLLEWPVYLAKKNPFYNLVRFGLFTKQYIPEIIYLETTNACNAKCFSCPRIKMNRPIQTMDWTLFTKIIDDLKNIRGFGLNFVLHIDGEPLLDPLIFDRIRYIKQNLTRSKIHFNTNVNLMTEEKIRQIFSSGLDSITFSIDGTTKETYEKIKTGMNFELAIHNVQNYFRIRKELGLKKPITTMQMVVNSDNQHQIEDYKKTWSKVADKIFIKSMLNFLVQGTSIKTSSLSQQQIRRCFQPVSVMGIYSDGRIALCCWDYDHLAKLGDAKEDKLIDLFNSPEHQTIRQAMLKMDCKNITPCNICSQIYGHDMNSEY